MKKIISRQLYNRIDEFYTNAKKSNPSLNIRSLVKRLKTRVIKLEKIYYKKQQKVFQNGQNKVIL
jgi:hypothetical protein